MKRDTQTILYGIFIAILLLIVYIAYAQVTTELKIEGEGDATEQEGVYITDVEYLTNNGANTENSEINYYLGTMLDSKVVLGSSANSSITYQVTIKNNTDREQVFIGIIKDETDEAIYSNTNIQPNVETAGGVTGIEKGVTTIAPGETLTFPVTFAYAGTNTSNPELQSKINFRFRELPILELSNEGETYILEDVAPGFEEEIEFIVSNYNENYVNGTQLHYYFEISSDDGGPVDMALYDVDGNNVNDGVFGLGTGPVVQDESYSLYIGWPEDGDYEEYQGKSYRYTVSIRALPGPVDEIKSEYGNYEIIKKFNLMVSTCSHTYSLGTCTTCGYKSKVKAGIRAERTSIYTDEMHNTAYVPGGFTVSGANTECLIEERVSNLLDR